MNRESAPAAEAAAHAIPKAPRRRRWLGTIIALVLMAALGGLAWHLTHRPAGGAFAQGGPGSFRGGPGGRGGPPLTTVGIAAVTRADIPVFIDALGTVTPSATVTVTPQVSGVLTKVLYEEGQMVRKGQPLAVIDPRPFELALMQAEGQLQRDKASLEAATVTLRRYETLLQQDSIARQDVDTQAAMVKQLQAAIVTARANENTARLNLGWSRIVAPVAGRVGLRPIDVGNTISAGDANGVAVITQLTPIDVAFSVPQDRVPEVQASVAAGTKLAVAAFDRTRTRKLGDGVFATLDNLVDVQTGTVKAKARFANADVALFPNQFVNVRLLLRSIEGAIVVPVTAMRTGPNGDYVYVVNEDRTVSVRAVERGVATNEVVAVTKGLALGERVVTEGGDRLRDGARVQLAGDAPQRGASGAAGGRRGASGAAAASGADGEHRRRRAASDGG
jgi:multidrug efflux system membrane fusion protein